jgi:hypothetical protein
VLSISSCNRGTAAARIILDSDTKTVEHKRVYHDAQHANGESTSKNEVWKFGIKM